MDKVSTNLLTGVDQKKYGFWNKVAYVFNQAAPNGAAKKPPRTLNSCWNRAASLVSKWCGCVAEAYQKKPGGANKDDILQNAHDSCEIKMEKKFNLMHWWYLLRDQPKWESACDQSLEASSKWLGINELDGHSDTSSPRTSRTPSTPNTPINIDSDDTPTTEVGGIIRRM